MSTATLSGHVVTEAVVYMPAEGVWSARVELDTAADLSGAVVLALAGLELRGHVIRGGSHHGKASFQLVGGAGGWRKVLPPRSYSLATGVPLSLVLGEAAKDVGETVRLDVPDVSVGAAFVRQEGPAARLFRLLGALVPSWWVGADGVTVVGPRASSIVGAPFAVVAVDAGRAFATLAPESAADLVPGRRVQVGLGEPLELVAVHHKLAGGKLRTDVWGAS